MHIDIYKWRLLRSLSDRVATSQARCAYTYGYTCIPTHPRTPIHTGTAHRYIELAPNPIYICIHISVYLHIYIYLYMHIYIYIYIYIYMCVYIYIYRFRLNPICLWIYVYSCSDTHPYAHAQHTHAFWVKP